MLPGIGLLLGPAIAIGSLILHAYALTEIGLRVEAWVAIGLFIFFMSVIGILYRQHQLYEQYQHATANITRVPAKAPRDPGRPTPEVKKGSKASERIFVDISPKDLMDLNKGRMLIERDRLLSPYIGKWVKISTSVDNAAVSENSVVVWAKNPEKERIIMSFDKNWANHVEVLRRGQNIKIVGEIQRVDVFDLWLENCELINE